ncbi:MAG: hypothetical protein LBJ16_00490 [Holosporaceae bacterium]|jgi:hypothetical protein|nr:hypothetical protein [Holosporaceae bacterium]
MKMRKKSLSGILSAAWMATLCFYSAVDAVDAVEEAQSSGKPVMAAIVSGGMVGESQKAADKSAAVKTDDGKSSGSVAALKADFISKNPEVAKADVEKLFSGKTVEEVMKKVGTYVEEKEKLLSEAKTTTSGKKSRKGLVGGALAAYGNVKGWLSTVLAANAKRGGRKVKEKVEKNDLGVKSNKTSKTEVEGGGGKAVEKDEKASKTKLTETKEAKKGVGIGGNGSSSSESGKNSSKEGPKVSEEELGKKTGTGPGTIETSTVEKGGGEEIARVAASGSTLVNNLTSKENNKIRVSLVDALEKAVADSLTKRSAEGTEEALGVVQKKLSKIKSADGNSLGARLGILQSILDCWKELASIQVHALNALDSRKKEELYRACLRQLLGEVSENLNRDTVTKLEEILGKGGKFEDLVRGLLDEAVSVGSGLGEGSGETYETNLASLRSIVSEITEGGGATPAGVKNVVEAYDKTAETLVPASRVAEDGDIGIEYCFLARDHAKTSVSGLISNVETVIKGDMAKLKEELEGKHETIKGTYNDDIDKCKKENQKKVDEVKASGSSDKEKAPKIKKLEMDLKKDLRAKEDEFDKSEKKILTMEKNIEATLNMIEKYQKIGRQLDVGTASEAVTYIESIRQLLIDIVEGLAEGKLELDGEELSVEGLNGLVAQLQELMEKSLVDDFESILESLKRNVKITDNEKSEATVKDESGDSEEEVEKTTGESGEKTEVEEGKEGKGEAVEQEKVKSEK